MTEVSVFHTAGTEKAPDGTAVESEETSTNYAQPDVTAAVIESTEKSAEPVLVVFCLCIVTLLMSDLIQ